MNGLPNKRINGEGRQYQLTTFDTYVGISLCLPFVKNTYPQKSLPFSPQKQINKNVFLSFFHLSQPLPTIPKSTVSMFQLFKQQNMNMNFFLKGDFKIGQSWQGKPARNGSREKSREKDRNKSLVNAARNIVADPKDILDDDVTKHILKEFAAEIPPPPSARSEKKISHKDQNAMRLPPKQKSSMPSVGGENDLLTSMSARLRTVQVTLKNQREELKDNKTTIEKLKAQNAFLKGFREDATKEYQRLKRLQEENDSLKTRVSEMEEYLKKYGLKWVGGKLEGELNKAEIKKAIAKGNYQYRLPREIDINTVTRRIQQLNAGLYSEGMGTEVYHDNGIHKFRKAEPLPIGFFANGIAIKGYKFLSYQSKESLQVLGDLIDGYFPYILKGKYPNGVFLKAVDKLAERYVEESAEGVASLQSKDDRDFKPPSKQEFLQKLPKSILKNGKVIKIRDQIQKRLNGEVGKINEQPEDEENEDFERNDGVTVFKTKEHGRLERKEVEEDELCTLKVRNEQGDVFILHLSPTDTMGEVYRWMKKVVKGDFKIMGNFPRRSYEKDEQENLETLGFFPNAMLHIQPIVPNPTSK